MYHKKWQLLKKTGPDGIGRYDFLRLLKKEFQETNSEDSKIQILANLANFAYDPINYDYIRTLQIIELFLEHLYSENEVYVSFSIAALCNLSSDSKNRTIIINKNGVSLITQILFNSNEKITLNAITTLIFLKSEELKSEIYTPLIVNRIKELQNSNNKRIVNLATIFLENK